MQGNGTRFQFPTRSRSDTGLREPLLSIPVHLWRSESHGWVDPPLGHGGYRGADSKQRLSLPIPRPVLSCKFRF